MHDEVWAPRQRRIADQAQLLFVHFVVRFRRRHGGAYRGAPLARRRMAWFRAKANGGTWYTLSRSTMGCLRNSTKVAVRVICAAWSTRLDELVRDHLAREQHAAHAFNEIGGCWLARNSTGECWPEAKPWKRVPEAGVGKTRTLAAGAQAAKAAAAGATWIDLRQCLAEFAQISANSTHVDPMFFELGPVSATCGQDLAKFDPMSAEVGPSWT